MSLWMHWWNAIWRLRPAFSRLQTFLWFAITPWQASPCAYTDMLGVTSIVRALNLDTRCYNALIDCFHNSAVKLDRLTALWTQVVLRLFPRPLRANSRCILVGDGIKIPKCGRKMPAVKLLHQQSEANTKREYITGHSLQAVSLLVQAASSFFAVPLAVRIHEGLVWSNRDRRTLLDKMLALLGIAAVEQPFYFVADAYYAAHKIVAGLLQQNNHLLTRMEVQRRRLYRLPAARAAQAGRPRVYGRKIKLQLPRGQASSDFQPAPSPVYHHGENKVIIQYRVRDLLWRPAGRLVRFVAVIHPTRGACLLMCTDTSLDAIDIIRLYGLRFKIVHTFKQAVRQIGSFTYHFWMSNMKPRRRSSGNPASPSFLARVHQRRQAQASRLPRHHPGRHHLPGTASVPCRCPSPARLELFRLLAYRTIRARHPALRARRRHRATPEPPRISLEYPPKLHLHEIRHRTTGHQQNAGLPPRRLIPKFLANPGLAREHNEPVDAFRLIDGSKSLSTRELLLRNRFPISGISSSVVMHGVGAEQLGNV